MRKAVSVVAAVSVLAACSTSAIDNVEYEAASGAYTVWQEGAREEPVEATGTTFDGVKVDLADYRGQVVLINTWYAACPPCRAEATDLAAIHEDYPDVVMLGVNTRDAESVAASFERSFEIDYPSIEGRDGKFIAGLEGSVPLQAVPTTLILDVEGRPAARYIGRIDPDILRGILDDIS